MSKYQAYPEYKDSGFGWLGNIPTHWVVSPIKWQIEKVSGGAWGQDPNGVEDTFVLRSTEQTHDGEWKIEDPASRRLSPQEAESTLLKEDDLLMTKSSGSSLHIGKTTIVTGEIAKLRCGYSNFMQRIRIKEDYIARFYWYIFNNELARKQLDYLSSSTTGLANLNATVIGEIICSNPPKVEQEKIVYFLDHETAKIDTLIDKQQQLIQLLKEKRQAVISHAVTKGLNPNAPMRDSGVEWLGEVPEQWKLPKLIHQTSRIGDGLHATPLYQDNTGYYFVNGNNLVNGQILVEETAKEVPEEEYKKHYIYLDESSVLLSINGTIGNVARYNNEMVILGKSAAYMNCSGDLLPGYLMLYLQSSQALHYFDLEVTGTTIFNLSLNSIRQMKVCVPPKHDQLEINQYCKLQKNKYDTLIEKASAAIRLMQERRTALISAAVTGKIDVRHHASHPTGNDTSEVSA